MHKLIRILFFCCIATAVNGQESFLKNYTVSNGLSGQNIYKMLNDRNGFIWFCTDDGVSRFNGFDFENYNLSNGFPGDGALTAEVDKKGRIWFVTLNEQLCYYDQYRFYGFKTPYPVSWIFFNPHGDMFLLTTNGHVLQYDNGGLRRDIVVSEGRKLHTGCSVSDRRLIVHSAYLHKAFIIDDAGVRSAGFSDTSFTFLRFSRLHNNTVLAANGNGIYRLDQDSLLPVYRHNDHSVIKSSVFCIYDDYRELLVGASNGMFGCKNERELRNAELIFNKGIVTSIIKDRNDNYWFATWSNGVYTFKSGSMINTFFPNQAGSNVRDVRGYDAGPVFIFYENGIIKKVQYRNGNLQLKQIANTAVTVNKVTKSGHGTFTLQTTDGIYVFDGKRTRRLRSALFFYEGVDGSQYSLSAATGLVRKYGNKNEVLIDGKHTQVLLSIPVRFFAANNDTAWLGNGDGIYRLTKQGPGRKYGHPDLNSSIADMAVDRAGTLWVAYRGQGVYYVRNDRLAELGAKDQLYMFLATT